MTHTSECLRYQQTLAEDRAEWIAKYPNYCRRCEGAGELYDPGNRDEPPSVDDCECLDAFRCPRCGAAVEPRDFADSRIMVACLACGWSEKNADNDPDHQCPPAFDGCGCGQAEEDAMMQAHFDAMAEVDYEPGDGYSLRGLIDQGMQVPPPSKDDDIWPPPAA